MNRRNFIRGLLTAAAGFTILPGAGRVWKAVVDQRYILNPAYETAPYEMTTFGFNPRDYVGLWTFVSDEDEKKGFKWKPEQPPRYDSQMRLIPRHILA